MLRSAGLFRSHTFVLGLFVVALCFAFAGITSSFATFPNAITILAGSGVLAIVALGQTFAMIGGGFDLSVSGVAPLAAVLFCEFSNARLPLPLSIVLVVAVGVAVGALNGFIIAWIRINALITTLGMLSITGGLAYAVSSGVTVPLNNAAAGFLANPLPGNIPTYVVLSVALAVAGALTLNLTTLGRRIYAVGGNRLAAWLSGIRVDGVTVLVFTVSGGLAAVAGIIVASELLAGSGTVEADAALNSIAAVVLGGAALTGGEGTVLGTMLGVLVIGIIGNGLQLSHISSFFQEMATGAILLIAVGSQRLRGLSRGRSSAGDLTHPSGTLGVVVPGDKPSSDAGAS